MRIELQITSPGTSEYLKLLGIRLKSDWVYKYNPGTKKYIFQPATKINPGSDNITHTYSIAELGIMIPWGFFQASPVHKLPGGIWQMKKTNGKVRSFASEVEARAWYLIDLIEEEQITIDQVNHPEKYNQPAVSEKQGHG